MFQLYLRQFLLLIMVALSAGVRAQHNVPGKRPNILFIFTDDQRRVGTFLSPDLLKTPVLDSLAHSGISFQNSYIMGGTSGAVCAPSRGSMFTGRSVFEMRGNYGQVIPDSLILLPQYLKANGYYTWMTGKWHNEYAPFVRSFSGGASIFFSGMGPQYAFRVNDFRADGQYTQGNSRPAPEGVHATDLFADEAIRFLESYKEDDPFFAYVAFKTPHDPRTVALAFQHLYDPATTKLPPNFLPEHPFDNGDLRIRDEQLAAFPRDSTEIRKHIADYYAMITHIDQRIGDILNVLKRKGLDKNTLVIFASDNGLAVGQHGLMGKQNLYEHSVGVPLIFSGPGVWPHQSGKALTYLTDIFPTLCNYLGLPVPAKEQMMGESLLPALQGKVFSGRTSQYYIYANYQRALRKGPYKLIEYLVKGTRHTQLFNLDTDPWETRDIAGAKNMQPVIRQLRAEMQRWHQRTHDPMPVFYGTAVSK
ncbi:sulfatase-like hydrolase/transferase [Niabella pedocola]|uniref:Sulfatase-like hydrolase/transferase n=1 Tax=Niabella pedocola TaxID=1752077 RepID=A0ABS8PLX8_9BACT|nr:sulfatase-like hydrolase/transferase [Niabella pedocola]MCD2421238.1 sulfatase-like hydrolase/transferase [Niabella pedocola]